MDTIPANPFKGLRPYSQRDRDKLFGRDRDLILMKDRIFSARTTLLFAGSGVGKTSFLNAKVIPELKRQCAVVWHNRWTGADEIQDPAEHLDEPIRWWPPRVLVRELVRKFRSLRGGDISVAPVPRDPLIETDDPFETDVRKIISQALRRSPNQTPPRLSEVFDRFRRSTKSDSGHNRCVLILDQFEEVFQYHAYEDYFRDFVKDVCEIINNDDYQVRVIFSMREEFLGELSVFDNRIPDIFNNYYRLRYPDKEEAEDIIRRTCQLSGVDPDESKLPSLVEDLSKIAKGSGSFAERSTNPGKTGVQVIKRDFVAPPYLQIACERLWNRQYAASGSRIDSSSARRSVPQTSPAIAPFLINYRAGVDGSIESGGDAQRAVVSFCEEKLSRPLLSRNEQDIVARAFSFLVTKQGAKMAYELSSLADHMQERVRPLKTALEKLSQEGAKILRESRGPDRSYWFELYHDMYAPIVEDWKTRYLEQRRRRHLLDTGLVVIILVLAIASYYWLVAPRSYRARLENFRDQVCAQQIPNRDQVSESDAVSAFSTLANRFGYRSTANSLWAQVLDRRAQCFERNNDPSSAILTFLKAATMQSDKAERERSLKAASVLMGAANGSLIATYCDDCDSATLSPDGRKVLGMNVDGRVRLWEAETGKPLGDPFCSDCRQSLPGTRKVTFSADGEYVLTAAGVRRCEEGGDLDSPQERGLKIQIWDTATQKEQMRNALCLVLPAESDGPTANKSTSGRANSQDKAGAAAPSIDVRGFTKIGETFWIATVQGNNIRIWNQRGESQVIGSGKNPPSVLVTFSPDGRYLAGVFGNESINLWRVSGEKIEPYPFKNPLAVAFGPSHGLLTQEPGNIVNVIDLDSGKTVVSVNGVADLPPESELQNIGFAPKGEQFITRVRSGDGDFVRAWRSSNGEPSSNWLNLFGPATSSGLAPDGKSVMSIADGDLRVIEKWDLPSGRLIGAIKRKFDSAIFHPDRNSILIFAGNTARLWAFDAPSDQSYTIQAQDIEPWEMSADGASLLTINRQGYLQFWDAEKGTEISKEINLSSTIRRATMSANGRFAATETEDHKVRIWDRDPMSSEPPTFDVPGDPTTMALSADGQHLARASLNEAKVWSVSERKEVTLRRHTDKISDVAVTNDVVITGSKDRTAIISDVATGKELHTLRSLDAVGAVAIRADSQRAATGDEGGRIRLWNVEKGSQLDEMIVKDPIRAIRFSSDGSTCAVLTPWWIYIARLTNDRFTYYRGTLIADPWHPIFSVSSNGQRLRFAYPLGLNTVQLQNLDLEPANLGDFSEPEQALQNWQNKLGLRVCGLGTIKKSCSDEPLDDAAEAGQSR